MSKILDVEQGTPEWFAVRKGKMTASHAQAIGNYGKGMETYIIKMMSEYYSSGETEHFSSSDTDRGNEYEPVARQLYEFERGVTVRQVGFIEYNEFVGASPDGLVDDDAEGEGGTEIKSVNDENYLRHLLYAEKEIESKWRWQVQMNLKVTGRKWWDLIIYNPNFENSMCVYRIYPDAKAFEELEIGFQKGEEMIKSIKAVIEKNG